MRLLLLFGLLVLLGFGCITLFFIKKSLLRVLISIEFLAYGVILVYLYIILDLLSSARYIIALFCFAAAGAACGLAILITFSRHRGRDLIGGLLYEKNSWARRYIKVTKSY